MKNHDIDYLLVAAAHDSDTNKHFVSNTMQRIRLQSQHETFASAKRKTSAQPKWSAFMKLAHAHKILSAVIALTITGIVTFSGYAYAIGTDPISLIRRWVEGNSVKLDYGRRQFEYGVARNYSDAAVTAFAELNLTDLAHFKAANRLQVPNAGIEHVSDPQRSHNYVYPTLAYIRQADASNITIEKVYLRGDKVTLSKDMAEGVVISEDDIFYYRELKQLSPLDGTGKLVALYQDSYLRHKIGEHQTTPVTTYFAFELTHPLQDYRDSDAALREAKPASGPRWNSDAVMPLLEKNFGAFSNICDNNGADTCQDAIFNPDKGQSLYGKETDEQGQVHGLSNPGATAYEDGTPNMISRNVEGKITQITDNEIVIKGSSGTLWYLEFSMAKRSNFKQSWGKDLQPGMTIGATFAERTDNLDNRHISDKYLWMAKVY